MSVSTKRPKAPAALRSSYAEDYYGWAIEQAALLRAGDLGALDRENLAEEIEDLGRGEFRELRSALRVLMLHMLKWDWQTARRSRSWAITIRVQRDAVAETMEENPSLKPRWDEAVDQAYRRARLEAAEETRLPLATFPETCPYSGDDLKDRDYPID
jgi:hypothetical protein